MPQGEGKYFPFVWPREEEPNSSPSSIQPPSLEEEAPPHLGPCGPRCFPSLGLIRPVDILLNIKGKAILSGYDHEIYNTLLENGWKKVFLGEYSKSCIKAENSKKNKGQEFVWINFDTNN